MTERIGIIGSRTYPTKQDVVAFIATLPIGTIVISGGAHGPDTWAVEAAKSSGLTTVIHWPDLPRYGSPSAYYHRNVKIVDDADRIVAFAAKDPKTKAITAGTTMTLGIAERSSKPATIVETPVPAKLCEVIYRLRNRYENVKSVGTEGQRRARIESANEHLETLIVAESDYHERLSNGWTEIEAMANDTEKERMESTWLKFEAIYRILNDVIAEARMVFA